MLFKHKNSNVYMHSDFLKKRKKEIQKFFLRTMKLYILLINKGIFAYFLKKNSKKN